MRKPSHSRLPSLPRPRQRSYCDCIFIHNSGVVPKATASRIAIAAEIPALPFSTRDSVTRVTRKWAAAVHTPNPQHIRGEPVRDAVHCACP